MSERGSRFEASVLTFGPVGRVACTLVLLGVLAWFVVWGGPFGIAGAVVWVGWAMPWALRDIWRPAALPSTDLTRLRDEARREIEQALRGRVEHPVFRDDQPSQKRW